jgi:polar amino acid transport system substrate-binding protein
MNAALLLLAVAVPAGAADLRFGTDADFPPYVQVEAGRMVGYEPDMLAGLCADLGHDCRFAVHPFDQLLDRLDAGEIDAVLSGMSATPGRSARARFTQAYAASGLDFYVADPGADLAGARVAAQSGSLQADHVLAAGRVLVEAETLEAALALLVAGQAEALLAPQDFIAERVLPRHPDLAVLGEGVATGSGPALAFRLADAMLAEDFDTAIGRMKSDGRLNALYRKWFGIEGPF